MERAHALIQQPFLTETLLMAVAASVCGLLLANLLVGRAGAGLLPESRGPAMCNQPLDGRSGIYMALAFGVAHSCGVGSCTARFAANVNEI